jgi:hypothetical protein
MAKEVENYYKIKFIIIVHTHSYHVELVSIEINIEQKLNTYYNKY